MSEILSERIQDEINQFVVDNTNPMREELVRRLKAHIDACNLTLDEGNRVQFQDNQVVNAADRMLFPAE